jgi:hypothetical protein
LGKPRLGKPRLSKPCWVGKLAAGAVVLAAIQDNSQAMDPSGSSGGEVDFAKLADQYLAAHPVEGKRPGEVQFPDIVDQYYVTAEVGVFEVKLPRSFMSDKGVADDFKDVATALVDLQTIWLDWVKASGEGTTQARADSAAIKTWLKNARLITGASKAPNFFAAFGGAEQIEPVVKRFRDSYRDGTAYAFAPHATYPQQILICPTRADFIDLAALLGHFKETGRSLYWNQGLISWTEIGWEDLQILAIQYPPPKPRGDDLSEGIAMDSREPTGMLQHIVQRAGVSLCWYCFGKALDPAVELGIAQTLVIDLYGQNNTRSGGGGRGNEVTGMTAFIPGGNSNGGDLPQTNAESSWRTTLGTDYFEKPLRASQKDAVKAAKSKEEKAVYFTIRSDDTSKRHYVRAPFFGTAAQGKEAPPPEFMVDYQEFFRAYKTLFIHWMRENGAVKASESHDKFAELMRKTAEASGAAPFEDLVKEVYDQALSSADGASPSLEWRFVAWLAKK